MRYCAIFTRATLGASPLPLPSARACCAGGQQAGRRLLRREARLPRPACRRGFRRPCMGRRLPMQHKPTERLRRLHALQGRLEGRAGAGGWGGVRKRFEGAGERGGGERGSRGRRERGRYGRVCAWQGTPCPAGRTPRRSPSPSHTRMGESEGEGSRVDLGEG